MNITNFKCAKGLSKETLHKIEDKIQSLGMKKNLVPVFSEGEYRTSSHVDNEGVETYQIEWISQLDFDLVSML